MKTVCIAAVFAIMMMTGLVQQASAQAVPDVRNLTAFSAETRYMSLPGYLRWQMYLENGTWISRRQAVALVRNQLSPALAALVR